MNKIRSFVVLTSLVVILTFLIPGLTSAATDKTKPTITGATNTTAYLNHSFNPRKGVKAQDNVDGNITDLIKISGKVNTKKAGKYTLTYKVTDRAKNTHTVKRVVTVKKDITKPKITGVSNKTVYLGYSFNPKTGVKATDNADGNLTSKIKVSGKVNTKKVGKYKIKYTVTDKSKNTRTATCTITVKKDTTNPKITGASNKKVYMGYSFNPKTGVKATDNVDGDITSKIKISGKVKTNEVGTYKLKYTVQDKTKNKVTVTRTIKVIKDTTKPKITGAGNTTINYGESFNPKSGVKATDNVDGKITNKMMISGSVDRYKVGTYKLTYTVKDKTGNKTTVTRSVQVVDQVAPTLSGDGLKDTTVYIGKSFDPLYQVRAADNADGNITAAIEVEGNVNVDKSGVYTLTYTVKDKSGNVKKAQRKVTVVDNVAPVLTVPGDTQIELFDEFDPMENVKATDNNDGDITYKVKIEGKIDTTDCEAGRYRRLIYTVSDEAGNKTTYERLVIVDFRRAQFSGVDNLDLGVGEQFDPMEGVKVTDRTTGEDITADITVENQVNVNQEGKYKILYFLPRDKGYQTDVQFYTRHVTVRDKIPPVIKGVKDIEINTVIGEIISPIVAIDGVTAEDNKDGDVTNRLWIEADDYDPTKSGEYLIKIKVMDYDGNVAEEYCKITLTVKKVDVAEIIVTSDLYVDITKSGKTFKLNAAVYPSNASYQDVTWESSDNSIATIDKDGVVTTLKEGTVTFTATGDGGVTGNLTIEVSDKPRLEFAGYTYSDEGVGASIVNQDDTAVDIDTVKVYSGAGDLIKTFTKEQIEGLGLLTTIYPSEIVYLKFDLGLAELTNETIFRGKIVVFAGERGKKTYEYTVDLL